MKENIREIVLSYGADLCGFASIERFSAAPQGFSPADIYADCKSVIAFALSLPYGLLAIDPRLIYGHFNYLSCTEVDSIAFKAAKEIETRFDCVAIPVPCDAPYEYWDSDKMEGRGLLSMKHIAVQSGLGTLGKNSMLVNERYGCMVTLGVILINAELPSDDLSASVCATGCKRCVEACPVNAIENGIVNQKLCREHTFHQTARGFSTVDCNLCRSVCPANQGRKL